MRRLPALVVALLGALAGCAHGPAAPPREVLWEGTVRVVGVETIPDGTTLVIRPGTRVVFAYGDADADGWGDAGIVIEGRVLARGTPSEPIVFEPEEGGGGRPGLWGEIRVESRRPSLFSGCEFRGARTALHAHFTPLRVESSLFENNVVATRFRGGPVEIFGNYFFGNGTAVRYWESSPEIISNVLEANGTGIFCREGSARTVVRGNNFRRSLDYHIKLGELQEQDVDARFNHWEEREAEQVEAMLFDRLDESYLGRVRWEPGETEPFPLEEAWRGRRPPVPAGGNAGESPGAPRGPRLQ